MRKGSIEKHRRGRRYRGSHYRSRAGEVPAPGLRRIRLAERRRRLRRRQTYLTLLAGIFLSAAVFAGIVVLEKSRGSSPAARSETGDSQNVIFTGMDRGNLTQILLLEVSQKGYSLYTLPARTLADVPGHGFERLDQIINIGGQPLLDQTVADLLRLPIRYHVIFNSGVIGLMASEAGSVNFKALEPLRSADGSVNLGKGNNPADPQQAMSYLNEAVNDGSAGPQIQALFYQGLFAGISGKTEGERRNFAGQLYRQVQTDLGEDSFANLFVSITTPGQPFGVWALPVQAAGEGQAWYFEPQPAELSVLTSGSPANSAFTLEIRNGGVSQPVIDAVTAKLAPLRFKMAPATDASDVGYDSTQIRCGSDALDGGGQVENLLGKGTIIKDDSLEKKQIIVIIGRDVSNS